DADRTDGHDRGGRHADAPCPGQEAHCFVLPLILRHEAKIRVSRRLPPCTDKRCPDPTPPRSSQSARSTARRSWPRRRGRGDRCDERRSAHRSATIPPPRVAAGLHPQVDGLDPSGDNMKRTAFAFLVASACAGAAAAQHDNQNTTITAILTGCLAKGAQGYVL